MIQALFWVLHWVLSELLVSWLSNLNCTYNDGENASYFRFSSPLKESLWVSLLVGLNQLVSHFALVRLEESGDAPLMSFYILESSYISFSALLGSCCIKITKILIKPCLIERAIPGGSLVHFTFLWVLGKCVKLQVKCRFLKMLQPSY